MKKQIHVFDYAAQICKALQSGVLLTTKHGETVNTMTIGWGTLGIEWNKPIFTAYVRESRFTREMLEKNPEFTVNIPLGDGCKELLRYCGQKSGRDTDKIRDLQLTLEEGERVSVPGIAQFPLTLECRVLYEQKQQVMQLPDTVINRFYPIAGAADFRDAHIVYYGEIVNAYIIES